MGSSTTPSFRLEFSLVSGRRCTPQAWRVQSRLGSKGYGQATVENLDRWVTAFEESMRNGPNKHLGLDQVVEARIIRQSTGAVVAEWKRSDHRKDQPTFEVIP